MPLPLLMGKWWSTATQNGCLYIWPYFVSRISFSGLVICSTPQGAFIRIKTVSVSLFWSVTMKNDMLEPPHDKTNKMTCAQRRLRSIWASAQSHQSSLSAWRSIGPLNYQLSAQWRLWSDWADAQADLSLRWAHMSFCWFRRAAAQLWKHDFHLWKHKFNVYVSSIFTYTFLDLLSFCEFDSKYELLVII